jgi:glucoamylase
MLRALALALVGAFLLVTPASAREPAPGAPGGRATWAPPGKQGFGTAASRDSRVWFTLGETELTEVSYPDLGHPSARSLGFTVDGRAVRAAAVSNDGLAYTQTSSTAAWRLERTYVTDPARSTVLVKVRFEALDGADHDVELRFDPQLYGDGTDDVGWTRGHALLAHDSRVASALLARPAFTRTSSGYKGHTGDLLEHAYDALRPGNVVQRAHTRLTGRDGHQELTLALGFAVRGSAALETAIESLDQGFDAVEDAYGASWAAYRGRLKPIPAAALPLASAYETSLLVLKAHEDKDHPGAFAASPSDHRVWARDLYQIATALLIAGDKPSADAALDFLLDSQQRPDGSFPRNSEVDGRSKSERTQMDEVALPIVLAWQLGRTDAAAWRHVRKAADYVVEHGPGSEQDRWGSQTGFSPGTIAAEIAGLVCAAAIARVNDDDARVTTYLKYADSWQDKVQRWTATATGPFSAAPYYLRLTKDRRPDAGTRYAVGSSKADQRRVVDPSFLELVRLGVKRADDPVIVNTVGVVDARLRAGDLWQRYDGTGAWPLLAGERGEYELAAGRPANSLLQAMADTANPGGMLPERVPEDAPRGGKSGSEQEEPAAAAAPLAWAHAQLVRLAWSVEARAVVERPQVVADRYLDRPG